MYCLFKTFFQQSLKLLSVPSNQHTASIVTSLLDESNKEKQYRHVNPYSYLSKIF